MAAPVAATPVRVLGVRLPEFELLPPPQAAKVASAVALQIKRKEFRTPFPQKDRLPYC
jgi:hypothetical protein